MEKRSLFSGTSSLEYMAENYRADSPTVSQYAVYRDHVVYDKSKLVIGTTPDGKPYALNLNKSVKMLLIAKTGSGKSVLTQGVMSRFHAAGELCAVPIDIKGDEYSLCTKPLQKSLQKHLLKFPVSRPVDEEPLGLPIKTYYPYFFSNFVSRNFTNQTHCQFRVQDINIYDFLAIAGLEDISALQKAAMEDAFRNVKNGELSSLEDIEKHLKESPEITKVTSKLLLSVIREVKEQGVVGSQFEMPDFVADINAGKIPVMNTYGAITGKKINNYISAYVAVNLRKIYYAKASNQIKKGSHLLLILDEINRMCPNDTNPPSRKAIEDMLRLSRGDKISMLMSCQYAKDVPNILIDQASHILVPARMDLEVLKNIFERFAPWEVENPVTMKQNLAYRQSRVPKWGWFIINKDAQRTDVMIPAMPLCYHKSE